MDGNYSTPEASVDPIDEIASLLAGETLEDDTQESDADEDLNTDEAVDSDDAEELSDESTEGDEESEESEGSSDEESEDALHEMLGIAENQLTVTDDGEFLINVKVDGVESSHPLSDVIKNYQLESSNTNKSKALAEERKAFESAAEAKAVELTEALDRAAGMTQLMEQELLAGFNAEQWDDLRKYDPAEWSAKREEYRAKYQRIQRVKDNIGQQKQHMADQEVAQQAEAQEAYLKQQYELAVANNPSWNDRQVFDEAMQGLMETANKFGFSDEEFMRVGDARVFEMLKALKTHVEGTKVTEKKKVKVPKLQKTKGRNKPKVTKLSKLTKAAKAATGANRKHLQTEAVAELLAGI